MYEVFILKRQNDKIARIITAKNLQHWTWQFTITWLYASF